MNPNDNTFKDEIIEEEIKNAPQPEVNKEIPKKNGIISRIILILLIILIIILYVIPEGIKSYSSAKEVTTTVNTSEVKVEKNYGNSAGSGLFMLADVALEGMGSVVKKTFAFPKSMINTTIGGIVNAIMIFIFILFPIFLVAIIWYFPNFNKKVRIGVILFLSLFICFRVYSVFSYSEIFASIKSDNSISYKGHTILKEDYIEYNGYYYFKDDVSLKRLRKNGHIVETVPGDPIPQKAYIKYAKEGSIYFEEAGNYVPYKFDLKTGQYTSEFY